MKQNLETINMCAITLRFLHLHSCTNMSNNNTSLENKTESNNSESESDIYLIYRPGFLWRLICANAHFGRTAWCSYGP